MTALLDATLALTAVLHAENACLANIDLAGAAALLPAKQAALERFTTAGKPGGGSHPALLDAAAGLRDAANENRHLLQRAMATQTRVLGVIAGAARQAQPAPRYGRMGALAAAPRTAWALSAQA